MAEQDTTPDTTVDEPDTLDTTTDTPDTDTDEPDNKPDKIDRSEFDKVVAQRDKAKAELRALKGADKPDADKSEPSEADTLRTALRRTAAVSVLSAQGITDKADQDRILSTFNLDALEIDGADVDTDTLADYLDTMKRVFGGQPGKRAAPAVDTRRTSRDSGDATDPDARRYKRIMGAR